MGQSSSTNRRSDVEASTTKRPTATGTQLDIVFCCDCTGSMGAYIMSAQENIVAISQTIHDKAANVSVRYGLVKYRDHPPQDSTYVTEVFPFTSKIATMKKNVDTMAAQGGGDGPEAVTAGLYEVLNMEWRTDATKVCVFIADAPPHGLGEDGDGFPEGCPMGHDPIQIAKALAEKGVVVYAVGVEPVLSSSYKYARDFMMMIAKVTEGKFLPLGKADILAQVIVSGTLEGMDMANVWEGLEKEVVKEAETKGEKLSEQEQIERVEKRMVAARKECVQFKVENPYENADYNYKNVDNMFQCEDLKAARKKMNSALNSNVQQQVQSYNWAAQECKMDSAPMAMEQCSRAANHARKSKGLYSYA